jgi:hypothetical protein
VENIKKGVRMESERLESIYEKWETKDLIKAVTVDKEDFEPFALTLIQNELVRRNIKDKDTELFQKHFLEETEKLLEIGEPFCPKCHSLDVETRASIYYQIILKITGLPQPLTCCDCRFRFLFKKRK